MDKRIKEDLIPLGVAGTVCMESLQRELGRTITTKAYSYKAKPKLSMVVVVVGYAHISEDVKERKL